MGTWGSLLLRHMPERVRDLSAVHDMCVYGVSQVRAGKYDVIRFDTFNNLEHEDIANEMTRIAPDVKYFFSPLFEVKP